MPLFSFICYDQKSVKDAKRSINRNIYQQLYKIGVIIVP